MFGFTPSPHLQPVWSDIRNVPPETQHYLAVSTDSPLYRAPPDKYTWFLHPMSSVPPHPPADMTLLAAADFQSLRWGLYGTEFAKSTLTSTQLLRLHCFFRSHQCGYSRLWQMYEPSLKLLHLYTQGILAALAAGNLGVWATLVEARVPHLPYSSHPVLQLLRGSSHMHDWLLSTPPPPA